MSNIFWKNINLCFSKFKCPPPPLSQPPSPNQDHNHPSSPITTSTTTTTSIMIKNFNSLYDLTSSSSTSTTTTTTFKSHTTDDFLSSSTDDTDSESPPDFATLYASQRFFFSSPGRSNSIFESYYTPPESDPLVHGGVAIPKYSPDPYMDFRRSMQEMVEARDQSINVKDDWEYLHELLLCYLSLNPQHAHKFIISAFADLVISLMSSNGEDCRESFAGGRRRGYAAERRLL